MRLSKAVVLVAALAVSAVLAACGGDGDGGGNSADGGGGGGLKTVKVLHSKNSEQLAIFVAKEADLFAKHGLNVELQEAGGAGQITPAIAGGTGDLGLSTATELLSAVQEGVPIAFATGTSVNTPANPRLFMVAGKSSGVTSPAGLAGKRVAVPSRGSFAEVGAAILLERQGVNPDGISWVEMPFPQMTDSLNAGRIDAAVAVVPFVGQMEAQGHKKVLNFADLGERLIIVGLSARKDWAEKHKDELRAFKAALTEAAERIQNDRVFAKEVEAKYTGLPKEIVDRIPFGTYTAEVTAPEVQLWIDMLVQRKALRPGIKASDVIVSTSGGD